MDSLSSIQYIIDHRCSVSRFGDGELSVMMGGWNEFQKPDKRLADRLIEVIKGNAPNHINAIPYPIKKLDGYIQPSQIFWGPFVVKNYSFLKKNVPIDKTYLDTQLSRFYFMYQDKSHCKHQIELLKKIWDGEDIIIVEGVQTRSGVGNDLYDNAHSVKRILGPATNAFDMYSDMLDRIVRYASKDNLILLSYGMTATVLAYDLAKLGYWAIDLGHLDIEYEWYKRGAQTKIAIEGKFTNEAKGGNIVETCNNVIYQRQIVSDITKNSL